jgi:thermitase
LGKLRSLPDVLYAESNGQITLNIQTNDPLYGDQWGLNNFNKYADIDAVKAWEIYKGNPNNIIAIIDQGVDKTQPDLKNKIAGGDNGYNTTENHGTFMAGIAAAETNNSTGMAGVDWYAKIHSQKITGEYSSMAQGIIDAVNYSPYVYVINCSWTIGDKDHPSENSGTVRSAFAYAYKSNRTSVVCMGNHQLTHPNVVAFPAGYSNVIAVGATDNTDEVWEESAQGNHIDVCAPGVGIVSIGNNNPKNGTSCAAAFVSGLASLLKGFNNSLANDDIENIIKLGADDQETPGFDPITGYGRINANNSLKYLQSPYSLSQWSETGGTIANSTSEYKMVFMGVTGLSDGVYFVKKYEVRKTITFSKGFYKIEGVWGRGAFTKGFNSANPNMGEGYCEIVPGTLTNTGVTLSTYIYQVWTINRSYLGYYPKAPSNVVYEYSVLGISPTITGPSTVCSSGTSYTIGDVPEGQTVTWNFSPNLQKVSSGTNIITLKCIGVGVGWVSTTIGSYTTPQKPIWASVPFTPTSIFNFCCNGMGFLSNKIYNFIVDATGASQYNWIVNGGTIISGQGTNSITVLTSNAPSGGISFDVSVRLGNDCGWSSYLQRAGYVAPIIGASIFSIYPNPTSSEVTISASDATSISNSISNKEDISITGIKITDSYGNIKEIQKYVSGQKSVKLDVSGLQKGIYIIIINHGLKEESHNLVIQ